ncbi:hypothetical protein DE146DRAFT_777474 [Phaeosphaeria sp. MPI-PUGE-AT-0046c]|nr:hypothetical protein DE146DRAFT_777474 [Phaeosphaeria sp. MPI-PUGE-AT-0046c]
MVLFKVVLGATIALAALVSTAAVSPPADDLLPINITIPSSPHNTSDPAIAGSLGYDPSEDWHDYSTAQVWMGKAKVTVGNLVGFPLYSRISSLLNQACPEGAQNGRVDCNPSMRLSFESQCLLKLPSDTNLCETILYVSGRYHSRAIRRNLIIAAAGAFQAFTSIEAKDSSNCFHVEGQGGGTMCNVGDVVRVHFPDQLGERNGWNYLHVHVYNRWSGNAVWGFDCCRGNGRQLVDQLMTNIDNDVGAIFPWMKKKEWPHDSRCIINSWDVCP